MDLSRVPGSRLSLRARSALLAGVAALAACPHPPDREARTQDVVRSWVEAPDSGGWRMGALAHPVAVYADRSRSMRGFLDPKYPTRVDYRTVFDGLQARLGPRRVYGFGSSVRMEPNAGLDVLGNREFYGDRDTEMEEALDSIARDTLLAWSHVVIGDARRSDPDLAHRQFVRMRELALRWSRARGTFLVAVSRAPFRPVQGDPSGCHAASAGERGDSARQCPLYAFVFAAPGDGIRIAAELAGLFEHVWGYPLPTAPLDAITLRPGQAAPEPGVGYDAVWLSGPPSVPKLEADSPATRPFHANLVPTDTSAPAGRLLARLLADGAHLELFARPVTSDSTAPPWARQNGRDGPLRAGADGSGIDVFSPGGDDCVSVSEGEPCGTLYRIEARAPGAPPWLPRFEAREAADAERTFGLGRLFEPFLPLGATAPPLARTYLLVR
ncbi:hypothetical protein [Longimicrobium sp.]|uniref:hypothetical protein n=1 Tax=Longimicrobium sp. TaxID=2029185 RepID=UPI002D177EE4|nr:hypothetical protein [Longimicrobium sp.]HSU17495.1 hypothetical protein [Longimicrobium sp.]